MRSVPIAMTWELLQRGRWQILTAFLGANLLPLLLLTALRLEGVEDFSEPTLLTLQVILMPIHIFTFGAVLFAMLDNSRRAYTLPIPTSTLVAWRLIPAMMLIMLEMLISIVALNALYGMSWPVWGPVLLAPTAIAMVLSVLWYTEKSVYLVPGISAVGAVIGLWYKSRSGPISSLPTHPWNTVTPAEVITLLCFVGISYAIAVAGVSRSRRGDSLHSVSLQVLLEKLTDRMSDITNGSRFQTPQQAQYWYEWQKKGWILPTIVAFVTVVTSMLWLLFSREPQVLVDGLLAGASMLGVGGFITGLIVGSLGPNESQSDIGSFLATRPLTNLDLARTVLKVMARTVLISWLMYVVAAGLVVGALWTAGLMPQSKLLTELHWWYWPATFLGCWISVSVPGLMMLTGRNRVWGPVLAFVFCSLLIVMLIPKFFDRETQEWWFGTMRTLSGIVLTGLSAWAMIAGYRKSVIKPGLVLASLIAWIAICAVIVVECSRAPSVTISVAILIIGTASLVFAPIAAAPMAVAWNRNR